MTQLAFGFGPDQIEGPLSSRHPLLADAGSVLMLLRQWQDAGWVQPLDIRFAAFLHQQCAEAPGLLLLAAALASHQLGRGHVCLDLGATLEGPGRVLNLPPERRAMDTDAVVITPAALLERVSLQGWESALHPELVSDGSRITPLVYDGGRLYLYRYWRYEQQVAHSVAQRVAVTADTLVAPDRVRAMVDVLFGPADGSAPDWQRLACALAVRSRFSIITGGPGTGKTTTVVRLLALLQAMNFDQAGSTDAALRIRLAAPTGKAAARLSESIAGRVEALPLQALPGGTQLAAAIPTRVTTLHRLLGGRPHSRQRRYHADEPLPLDVLVIDEASMVSLSDMADVVDALPPAAHLVLIGDKDQLASVEAGAVLGELCRRAEGGHYLPQTDSWLQQASGVTLPAAVIDEDGTPLDQAVAMLRVSHRFNEDSGIGRLAQAVNAGEADTAQRLLDAPPPDLAYLKIGSTQDPVFSQWIVEGGQQVTGPHEGGAARHGLRHYLEKISSAPADADPEACDAWALEVLRAHRSCQVLCVLREGPWGVHGLNASLARTLHDQGLISAMSGWYAGRPVMVTRNSPALRLANGDIGVVLPYPAAQGQGSTLRVAFPAGDGQGVRWFAPNRLDNVETVYALTVHKSQGSEFDHAVLVLPPVPTPVLTRELLYTGVTRASQWFTLVDPGTGGMIRHTIRQRVYRSGGLGELLHALR